MYFERLLRQMRANKTKRIAAATIFFCAILDGPNNQWQFHQKSQWPIENADFDVDAAVAKKHLFLVFRYHMIESLKVVFIQSIANN